MSSLVSGSVCTAAGIAVAALAVDDFRLDGPVAGRVATVVCAVLVCNGALYLLARAITGGRTPRSRALPAVLAGLVLWPLLLWACVRLARAAGADVRLDGVWPVVLSALVTLSFVSTCGMLGGLRRREGRRSRLLAAASVLLVTGVLAGVTAVLGGVRLEPGEGWRQALTIAVLALLYTWRPHTTATLPSLTVTIVLLVAVDTLLLWLLLLLAESMTTPLHMDGLWPLPLTAALLWCAEWPKRLAVPPQRSAAPPPPMPHDPFFPHGGPMSPLY
ncbi:hypothetical protein [Streptomyces sp. RFCAC02]|uniref:hypothetical protein n=1 Tax=Streptomyces sp. RFCAC02 TaxID=2499143 RepID=UPI0010209BAD|nr:hypothetical protein [Streptomyces sp. RFCAC02]